jgi:hypothetical protein
MLADGLRPALIGLVLGLAASAATTQFIKSMLYETQPLDPGVFAAVAALPIGPLEVPISQSYAVVIPRKTTQPCRKRMAQWNQRVE